MAWHSPDNTTLLILNDDPATQFIKLAATTRSIVTHPRQNHGQCRCAIRLSHAAKQYIDGRSTGVFRRIFAETDAGPPVMTLYPHMIAAGCDIDMPLLELASFFALPDVQLELVRQSHGKMASERRRHVLHNQGRYRAAGNKRGQQLSHQDREEAPNPVGSERERQALGVEALIHAPIIAPCWPALDRRRGGLEP